MRAFETGRELLPLGAASTSANFVDPDFPNFHAVPSTPALAVLRFIPLPFRRSVATVNRLCRSRELKCPIEVLGIVTGLTGGLELLVVVVVLVLAVIAVVVVHLGFTKAGCGGV